MYKHLSLILILIFLLSSQIKAQVEISKDRIVNSIKNNLHFSTAFPKSQQWREQYIDNLDIESLVDSVVSKPLVINSPEHIDSILERRIFITKDNKEYHSLIIKIAISDFILHVYQCNNTPLPDEKEKATILRDIEKIAETMNKSITLHLGGVISKNIIDSNIHDFEVILKNMIDDKLQPSLKKTMKGEEITHILQVFEGRLEKTKHRAFNRISAAKEENKVGEEALIIYELIEPVAKQIKQKTRVIDVDNFDANSIVPEYSSFYKRKNEIERAIRQKRAEEKERKRQMEIIDRQFEIEKSIDNALANFEVNIDKKNLSDSPMLINNHKESIMQLNEHHNTPTNSNAIEGITSSQDNNDKLKKKIIIGILLVATIGLGFIIKKTKIGKKAVD